MNILFTCGGTAGHINPALALARMLREREPDSRILFVGAKDGMEERLVPQAGYPLNTITVGSFWRKVNWSGFTHNVRSVQKLRTARQETRKILDQFRPDLVVGTGGYASYPVVREAARRGIPTAIHESNAVPGLTTRRLMPYADCLMTGFPVSGESYHRAKCVVHTGTPIRGEFFELSRGEAREKLGIPQGALVLLSMWGSLGANQMNAHMVDFIAEALKNELEFYHIHAAGGSYEAMRAQLEARGIELPRRIRIEEYIYDMPAAMMAADLLLCRGGASTLSELSAIGRAAIIVPSPNVTNDHQRKNAALLEERAAAKMILEKDCNGVILYRETAKLLQDAALRHAMEGAAAASGIAESTERIYQILMKILRKREN